jgi:pseudaminic acid biosynthesis-associated methylase
MGTGTIPSKQETHWTGIEGTEYHARQTVTHEANVEFFARALARSEAVSFIEFGCGAGLNCNALNDWDENTRYTGVDIDRVNIGLHVNRIIDWHIESVTAPAEVWAKHNLQPADLTFTKGCLIHIEPALLPMAYANLHRFSTSDILIAEYYNPIPVELWYRGNAGLLWKRDFAGEMLAMFPDLQLVDYGFHSRHDELPQDDITYFLLRKR